MAAKLPFKLISLCLLLAGACAAHASDPLLAELKRLDAAIADRSTIDALKATQISRLKQQLQDSKAVEQRYALSVKLFDAYKVYVCDSALKYGSLSLGFASKLGDSHSVADAKVGIANVLTATGMYPEAITTLSEVSPQQVAKESLPQYYMALELGYTSWGMYVNDVVYAPAYYAKGEQYRTKLLGLVDKQSPEYYNALGRKYIALCRWDAAKVAMQSYLSTQKENTRGYSIATSSLAHICKNLGDTVGEERYLIQAAISDLRSSVKENEALRKLSLILLRRGDIGRAYSYIRIAQEDAIFFNARLRRIENGQTLPIINAAYEQKMEQHRATLRRFLVTISVLAIVLALAVLLIYRQVHALKKARREIEKVNADLLALNSSLKESNHIKEEYVGHFLNLCSIYIGKLEKYQKSIYKKASSGQIDDVIVMTKSTQLIEYELKEFYRSFDSTFLTLFPSFIEEFNKLLLDEEPIVPKKDELLTTELRIFALIRLGIADSSQIAKFLRYSVNTVYTYRTKVKNRARVARDSFEECVMQIGSFC